MKFVVMFRDECGYEHRAHGNSFLEAVHEFPSFDDDNEAMWEAFYAWKNSIEEKAQKIWEDTFGPESRCFLERQCSDYSLAEMRAMGWGGDF